MKYNAYYKNVHIKYIYTFIVFEFVLVLLDMSGLDYYIFQSILEFLSSIL